MQISPIALVSVVFFLDAFVWIVGTVPTLYYALDHRQLPTVGGIRLLGGPFEALGIDALIVAGIVYVVVSAFKILAAYWLWDARMDGAVLGLVLIGLSILFWYGFALPLGPVLGITEMILLVVAWNSLR